MKKLREEGMTYKEIAEKIGVHPHTVNLYLCPSMREKRDENVKKYRDTYYQKNKEKINKRRRESNREYQKEYRVKNNERIKKYNKEYLEKNPEYNKEYRKNNLKHIQEVSRKHYSENKERIKKAWKECRLRNIEKFKTQHTINKHKRAALEKSLEHTFTKKEWDACLNYFNNKCAYCGVESSKLQQDHVIPISKNGSYISSNIVPACGACNVSKSNKLISNWFPQQPFYSKESEEKIYKYLGKMFKQNLKTAENKTASTQVSFFDQLKI